MAKTSPSRPVSRAKRAAAVKTQPAGKERYGAPALEKGLDVLELLAGLSQGVSQSEIAQLLGRSLQEVYRVVMVLERRGFIQRQKGEDGYFLSNRMFDLANRYPPLSRLINLATPLMRQAAGAANQALHMAVLDSTSIRVIAQVDSPAPFGFRLRVGTKNPAMATASGRLLVALQPQAARDWVLDELRRSRPKDEADALVRRTEIIRARGYEMVTGEGLQGITDVSFPLIDSSGFAQAALTMPYLPETRQTIGFDEACEIVFRAAETITAMLGGTPPQVSFPLARITARRPPNRLG
ncbi:IclR family transcriptional regulator [Mesorhizobium sp. GR13]|uniref:IclR family transcriptional regulator n=1 Tax=Mesorhizobium sp. GR13 TaxID=2562308 RepID=UPI0010C04F1E|nr:IclR family transcriptional regulator [Mesorhizobium sp. GR13]